MMSSGLGFHGHPESWHQKPNVFGPEFSRFVPQFDVFGAENNKFGNGHREFEPKQDIFGSGHHKFGPKPSKFGQENGESESEQNKFGDGQHKFGPQPNGSRTGHDIFGKHGFGYGTHKFESGPFPFGLGSPAFGLGSIGYGFGPLAFGLGPLPFGNTPFGFGPRRRGFGPNGGPNLNHQFFNRHQRREGFKAEDDEKPDFFELRDPFGFRGNIPPGDGVHRFWGHGFDRNGFNPNDFDFDKLREEYDHMDREELISIIEALAARTQPSSTGSQQDEPQAEEDEPATVATDVQDNKK